MARETQVARDTHTAIFSEKNSNTPQRIIFTRQIAQGRTALLHLFFKKYVYVYIYKYICNDIFINTRYRKFLGNAFM